MAQLALGVAGAFVGSFFGPIGTSIGWALGAGLGGALFAEKTVQRQPLQDTRYLDSSFGNPIDVHYGTVPVSRANVFWKNGFRAIENTTSSGGKGGPEVESTTYTYEIDVAISLSARECDGIGRIWIDNILRYDGRESAGAQAVISGGGQEPLPPGEIDPLFILEAIRQGANPWCDYAHFHPGSETQLPDSIIEAVEGVGMVPAYRGTCYLAIKGLKCGGFPRIPQIVIELIADGSSDLIGTLWTNTAASPMFERQSIITVDQNSVVDVTYCDENGIVTNAQRFSYVDGTQISPGEAALSMPPVIGAQGECILQFRTKPLYVHPTRADADGSLYVHAYLMSGVVAIADYASLFLDGNFTLVGSCGSTDERHVICFYRSSTDASNVPTHWTVIDTELWEVAADPEDASRGWRGTYDAGVTGIAPGGLTRYTFGFNAQTPGVGCMESDLRHIWITGETGGDIYLHKLHYFEDDDEWRIIEPQAAFVPYTLTGVTDGGGGMTSASIWADNGICVIIAGEDNIGAVTRYHGMTGDSPTLATVLKAVYSLSGYDYTEDLNVDSLTQEVLGFEFVTPSTPRAAFEALGAAYLVDFVESDGKIKGVARGGAVAAALTLDDLGASESGEFVEPLDLDRMHESEIPAKVSIRYMSLEGDYKRGAQSAENAVTNSNEQLSIDLPIVLEDDRAAELADILRRARWRARTPIKAATWAKFLKLEPTDVVTLSDGTQTRKALIAATRQKGILIELEAISEGGASYTSNAVGGAVPPRSGLQVAPGTTLVMLDIPAFLESHDGYGINAAAAGLLDGWPGAGLYRSADSVAYSNVGVLTTEATIGFAQNALGDYTGPFFTDEQNSLTVGLAPGQTLSSITDAELIAGGNLFALQSGDDWEIGCFRTATLVSGETYTLTGIVRGLYGTEHLIDGHAVGDAFVLLSTSTVIRIEQGPSDFLQTSFYKAVTFGRSLAQSPEHEEVFYARSLKPLSPVGLNANRNSDGSITLQWIRRCRIDGIMRDYWSDAPLDEAEERYEVDIYDDTFATVVRTISVDGDTEVDYTAAQVTEDWGDVQGISTLRWKVAQLSSTTNARGTEASDERTVAFGDVISLLNFNGANTSTTFTDETGKTWTAAGNAQLATADPKFGSAAGSFDGGSNSRISTPASNADWNVGADDFTLEIFYNRKGTHQTNARIFQNIDGDVICGISLFIATSSSQDSLWLACSTNGGASFNAANNAAGTLPTLGAGYGHIAVVRESTTLYVFINGANTLTLTGVTGSIHHDSAGSIIIGGQSGTSRSVNAHLDSFRFTRGAALYTSDFTPPASEFTYP